ncbi:MAG: alpha-L-glutamate ligase, partial [Bacteroidetes bacterium QS_4_64_154]
DAEGQIWTYDINGTTNYSPEVEDRHDLSGMAAVTDLLKRGLEAAATGEHIPS